MPGAYCPTTAPSPTDADNVYGSRHDPALCRPLIDAVNIVRESPTGTIAEELRLFLPLPRYHVGAHPRAVTRPAAGATIPTPGCSPGPSCQHPDLRRWLPPKACHPVIGYAERVAKNSS